MNQTSIPKILPYILFSLFIGNHSVLCFYCSIPSKSKLSPSLSSMKRFNGPDNFGSSKRNTCFGVLLLANNSDDNIESNKTTRKRRVRRKKDSTFKDDSDATSDTASADDDDQYDNDGIVEITIQDINAVDSADSNMISSFNTQEQTTMSSNSNEEDKLKSLLADAKRLRQSSSSEENENANMSTMKDILSTIVTIDFFVVFGFLIWFLVGVVSSNVLKDDTIQLAFNGIFQPVVQPALGILMIASIASGVTGQKTEE